MRNYVQRGDTLTVPAPREVASGDGVILGSIFGVANGSSTQGAPCDLDTVGVFSLPKVAALAFTIGEPVYWDDETRLVTASEAGTLRIGVAVEPASNPSAVVAVRLNGAF